LKAPAGILVRVARTLADPGRRPRCGLFNLKVLREGTTDRAIVIGQGLP